MTNIKRHTWMAVLPIQSPPGCEFTSSSHSVLWLSLTPSPPPHLKYGWSKIKSKPFQLPHHMGDDDDSNQRMSVRRMTTTKYISMTHSRLCGSRVACSFCIAELLQPRTEFNRSAPDSALYLSHSLCLSIYILMLRSLCRRLVSATGARAIYHITLNSTHIPTPPLPPPYSLSPYPPNISSRAV